MVFPLGLQREQMTKPIDVYGIGRAKQQGLLGEGRTNDFLLVPDANASICRISAQPALSSRWMLTLKQGGVFSFVLSLCMGLRRVHRSKLNTKRRGKKRHSTTRREKSPRFSHTLSYVTTAAAAFV